MIVDPIIDEGRPVLHFDRLAFGDACPVCDTHDCEYRSGDSDRPGYFRVRIDCHDCGYICYGYQLDPERHDHPPIPVI